jgi:NitT/TauT family transport system ATP-binding protein
MQDERTIVLECNEVSHWFGPKRVLNRISLRIAAGQIVAIVGPSGCGKSTLLRAILGTHPPRAGEILASGRRVTRPGRDVGIVYQDYALYDFLTARDNVAFGLMLDQTTLLHRCVAPWGWFKLRDEHRRKASDLLHKVSLAEAAHLFPREMSGGMRQRVAIAQALVMQPKILLLDEPFGALDEATREELQMMLLRLYEENAAAKQRGETPPYTIVIVTHELNEALYVSDRVLGLSQFHQDGRNGATIVYDKPAPVFRAGDTRDFLKFEEQKEELRRTVFDPANVNHHEQFVTFWKDHDKQS